MFCFFSDPSRKPGWPNEATNHKLSPHSNPVLFWLDPGCPTEATRKQHATARSLEPGRPGAWRPWPSPRQNEFVANATSPLRPFGGGGKGKAAMLTPYVNGGLAANPFGFPEAPGFGFQWRYLALDTPNGGLKTWLFGGPNYERTARLSGHDFWHLSRAQCNSAFLRFSQEFARMR